MALQRVLSDPKAVSSGGNVSLVHMTDQQKQAFELELRMYDGNDPLDVWDRYIKWIEDSHARSDKGSNLCAVLERAVQQFVDDKKFYDDPRYVDMWIKLAQNSTQPLNMFSYMQTEGIGVQQAALYVAWSNALEMQGDLQQADIIFLEGLKCGARPLDELQRHYRAFQSRLSGQAVEHGGDVTQEKQDIEPQLPSSVGRRTRRNRRVLASVNGDDEAGNSTICQPSTSGMEQSRSLCVFDESQARPVEHAVVETKENQFLTQKTDNRACSSGDVNSPSGPETAQSQNAVEPPCAPDEANQSEDQPGFQSMYCKKLLFKGPSEFCFEELRAERYFASMQQKLKEKQMHLNKEKERLRELIEKKLQAKSHPAQENGASGQNAEMYPDDVFTTSEEASERNVPPKPFTVFDENTSNTLPHETAPVGARSKSLKLPKPILKTRSSPSYPITEKDCTDRSLSQAEEAIVNSHRNKTLSISPDDTYDFARAAMLASTPFGGVRGQKGSPMGDGPVTEVVRAVPTQSCPNTTPQMPAEPTETNKLSPILEVSQEWRSMSAVGQRTHHTVGPASITSVTLPPVLDEAEEDMEQEMEMADPHEDQAIDPCSLEVRRRLLHQIGLSTLPNLHPEPGPLPNSIIGLNLGGQVLSYLLKMPDLENHYLLASEETEEDCVVLKVERSPVPWDVYICSQLKARLPADTLANFLNQGSCFLFEDGCVTLWRVPRETTLSECTANEVNEHLVAHLALGLVEMVIRMHTCHLVHGALRPNTLIYYPSPTPSDRQHSVVMTIDFSCSLDLQLQADVQTVGSLGNAADYVRQGLLSATSSPYELDLLGVAETVHQMLFKRHLDVVKTDAGWSLAETSEGSLHSTWHTFFQKILNSGEKNTVTVLTELQENLRDYTENDTTLSDIRFSCYSKLGLLTGSGYSFGINYGIDLLIEPLASNNSDSC